MIKKILKKKFQPINLKASYKDFDRKIYRTLRQEKFEKGKPWLFKDPKIALCWNIFNEYYPNAKWILLYRNENDILNSFNRTNFMNAYNTKKEWLNYLNCWKLNMQSIKEECKNVFEFNIENIFNNKTEEINNLYKFIGIKNQNKHLNCIDKNLFLIT